MSVWLAIVPSPQAFQADSDPECDEEKADERSPYADSCCCTSIQAGRSRCGGCRTWRNEEIRRNEELPVGCIAAKLEDVMEVEVIVAAAISRVTVVEP